MTQTHKPTALQVLARELTIEGAEVPTGKILEGTLKAMDIYLRASIKNSTNIEDVSCLGCKYYSSNNNLSNTIGEYETLPLVEQDITSGICKNSDSARTFGMGVNKSFGCNQYRTKNPVKGHGLLDLNQLTYGEAYILYDILFEDAGLSKADENLKVNRLLNSLNNGFSNIRIESMDKAITYLVNCNYELKWSR